MTCGAWLVIFPVTQVLLVLIGEAWGGYWRSSARRWREEAVEATRGLRKTATQRDEFSSRLVTQGALLRVVIQERDDARRDLIELRAEISKRDFGSGPELS